MVNSQQGDECENTLKSLKQIATDIAKMRSRLSGNGRRKFAHSVLNDSPKGAFGNYSFMKSQAKAFTISKLDEDAYVFNRKSPKKVPNKKLSCLTLADSTFKSPLVSNTALTAND